MPRCARPVLSLCCPSRFCALSSLFLTRSLRGAAAPSAAAPASAAGQAKEPSVGPAAPVAKDADVVVARIGEYTILRKELEERLLRDLRPQEEEFPGPVRPVTAERSLREILAEKAMCLEGRTLGYLKDETIRPADRGIRERAVGTHPAGSPVPGSHESRRGGGGPCHESEPEVDARAGDHGRATGPGACGSSRLSTTS